MKEIIFNTVEDLVSNFVYYDRKEDEDLSANELTMAIKSGEVTIEEIVSKFEKHLRRNYESN